MSTYPWRLRLFHEGHSAIRVERRGRWVRFDPHQAPEDDALIVLTWTELERARGTIAAIEAGANPEVVATPDVRTWLGEKGAVRDRSPGGKIEKGLVVSAMDYTPIPFATPNEAVRKVRAAATHPAEAARRLFRRARTPDTRPIICQLEFGDGSRLLHLNCSLHPDTDGEWLRRAQEAFGGADWVICGVDYEAHEAVFDMLPAFGGQVVLLTDLINETRQGLGLPIRHLTPLVDRLNEVGVDAYPFVSGASHRFE